MDYLNIFKKSFKLDMKYVFSLMLDLSFYILLFASFSVWGKAIGKWLPQVQGLEILSEASAQALINQFMFSLITYTLILAVVILILYSFFKGAIWVLILRKKLDSKYFFKFALLNLAWFSIISLLITAIGFLSKSITGEEFKPIMPILSLSTLITTHPYITTIILLLIVHTTAMLQIYFTQKPRWSSVKKAFKTFKKFHLFFIHYLFILIPLIAISLIGYLLRFLPETADSIISIIVLITFITWLRFYVVSIIEARGW